GLDNRRAFMEAADRALDRMEGSQHATLVMVDLDFFKQINDSFGHGAGDAVLSELADLLKTNVSDHLIGRFGGEEFLILVMDGLAASHALADALRERIASHSFAALPHGYQLTASFGIAMIDDASGLSGAIERADAMLYSSKKDGRN